MTENELNEILQCDDFKQCVDRLKEIFPNGFDINKQDIRLKNKLDSFIENTEANDYDFPIQLREQKSIKNENC